jgi:hypothetical protein
MRGGYVFRYVEQQLEQAVVQKLARVVSGLRAAHLLLDVGHLQEAAILQRSVDEAQEDTLFLLYGKLTDNWTTNHDDYLRRFWSEKPATERPFRRPIIRDYISATEARLNGELESVVLQPIKGVYGNYSEYAHGSSIYVMEMVEGNPASWQLKGIRKSQLKRDHAYDIRNQHYRGTIAHALAALSLNNRALFQGLMLFADEFMRSTVEPNLPSVRTE